MITGLLLILILVLILPFLIKKVEHNLEIFLFIMGLIAVTITSLWSQKIIIEALEEPIKITLAVLIAGLIFRFSESYIRNKINIVKDIFGIKLFLFLVVVFLGIISSMISAIIAALVLSEIISGLKLSKKIETKLVVLCCFAIGLGAALTPIGEPLSTIAIAKLKGEPYHADFWFLAKILWVFIIPEIIILGIITTFLVGKEPKEDRIDTLTEKREEKIPDILLRSVKIYLFVMGLIFLGEGFKPIIDQYIIKLSPLVLYWINIISAILDNATLTAAEISSSMSLFQIKSVILGLLISGGMLIPGNIPNIICAGKLKITSKEWAKIGIPIGLIFMLLNFFILL